MKFEEFIAALKVYDATHKTWAVNPQKEKQLVRAYERLTEIIRAEDEEAVINCKFNEHGLGEAVIHIESDWLVVREIETFCNAIFNAGNMDIRPNGKHSVVINIMFHDIFNLIT